jgi:undecaprenyl-diphosphatase
MARAPWYTSQRTMLRSLPREVQLLAALFAAALWLWVLALVVAIVAYPRIQKFDERVLLWFRRPEDLSVPIGPEWVLGAAREITALGSATVLLILIFSVAGYLLLERRYGLMGLVLVSTFGGVLMTTLLKGFFSRPRPSVVPHLVPVSSLSFPSGHSLLSAVVYLTLGALLARDTTDRVTKTYLVVLSATITVMIGLSRMYVGVHYPTDVLGGWVAGTFWALCCGLIARELQRRRVITPVEKPVPQRVSRSSSAA